MARPSIVQVTSNDPTNITIGTGFVIHHDMHYSYVLTCAHVVRDVGGSERVKVAKMTATVVAPGEADGLDLAVLQVAKLEQRPALSLRLHSQEHSAVHVEGNYKYAGYRALENLRGQLGKAFQLSDNDEQNYVHAWYIDIEGRDKIVGGYSGAPVRLADGGDVFAVIITRDGDQQGRAISLAALPLIWPDMPDGLLKPSPVSSNTLVQPLPKVSHNLETLPEAEQLLSEIQVRIKQLEELLQIKQRRLHVLEVQQAQKGISAEPHIVLEIEDLMREISELKKEITAATQVPPSNQRGTAVELKDVPNVVRFYLAAHQKWHGETNTFTETMIIDWSKYFQTGDPQLSVWQTELIPMLEAYQRDVRSTDQRTIHLTAFARNSAAFAFGYIFSQRAKFHIHYNDSRDQLWKTDELGVKRTLLNRVDAMVSGNSDIVLELALTQPLPRVQTPVDKWLTQTQVPVAKRVSLSLGNLEDITPSDGIAMARQICDIMITESKHDSTIHIFGALPIGVALMIGWLVKAELNVQWYELDNTPSYQPTCLLRT